MESNKTLCLDLNNPFIKKLKKTSITFSEYMIAISKNEEDLKNNHLSTITGLIINFFNFLTFLLASQNIYYTQLHLKIILFNVTFYLITYYFLSKKLKN